MMSPARIPFYKNTNKVREYIQMRNGIDGRVLVDILSSLLPKHSTLLELGMGPGSDLTLLAKHYEVTGSDISKPFLREFKRDHPGFALELLDAVTIETENTFDCIYSNKVLHHLAQDELLSSLARQSEIVRPNGLLFHSFWIGDERIEAEGMIFAKYPCESILEILSEFGTIVKSGTYAELNAADSFFTAVETKARS